MGAGGGSSFLGAKWPEPEGRDCTWVDLAQDRDRW
jgi:hypothetical protein